MPRPEGQPYPDYQEQEGSNNAKPTGTQRLPHMRTPGHLPRAWCLMAMSVRRRYEVLRRCNFACIYCGLPAPITTLHVDHVIPRALGGDDEPWNLVAACRDCNLGKTDGVPDEEFINRVRNDYCAYYESKGSNVGQCCYCGVPLIDYDGEATPTECTRCNTAVCDAYQAGVRSGMERRRHV